ncbi:MAG: ABC transporter ATP-binding protein [Clostridia bacterium]|nr:ABC transporter ATP-binding protein [Clostridia bacterium]
MKNDSLYRQLKAQFYRKNRLSFGLAAAAAFLSGFGGLIASWMLHSFLDTAAGVEGSLSFAENMIAVAAFLVMMVLVYLLDYVSRPAFIRKALTQYKDFAFQKLTEKSISSFRDESTAAYLSALSNDVTSIETEYLSKILSLLTNGVMFFGSIGLMLWYSPLLTAIAVGVTLLPFAASVLTGNRLAAAEKKVSDRNRDFTSALTDCLGGFSVVKSFKAEKEIFRLFAQNNSALEGQKFSKRRIASIVELIGSLTGFIAQIGVFAAGAYLALKGYGITGGVVIMFVNLMNFMIQPVSELPGLLAGRKAALGLIRKMADALEKHSEATGTKELSSLKEGIRLDDVHFSYGGDKEVLHGISAEFKAGKAYAVVGASGSGKSTLLNLLMASSADYGGKIMLDQTELRDVKTESLYELVSVIQQNVFVFNASIRDNVTMFKSFPQKEIEEAIHYAHLDALIAERGSSYLCGENGNGLSGGEKQRVSIARSLLKKSSVLMADEATAALDARTAHQVAEDILGLDGITRIVVTHALEESLLRRYDGILVLRDGRVVETGTFDELMENKGYFHALYTVSQ